MVEWSIKLKWHKSQYLSNMNSLLSQHYYCTVESPPIDKWWFRLWCCVGCAIIFIFWAIFKIFKNHQIERNWIFLERQFTAQFLEWETYICVLFYHFQFRGGNFKYNKKQPSRGLFLRSLWKYFRVLFHPKNEKLSKKWKFLFASSTAKR